MSAGRHCHRCGTVYQSQDLVEYAFRQDASCRTGRGGGRKQICRGCEQDGRDNRKRDNRWTAKARDTIRRHATRLNIDKAELIGRYGWDPKRLAHEAEYQYGNGCSYCFEPYLSMGHGLSDITLDIQDPAKPPSYRLNTKWCCQTCNRKKGRMTPEEFELDRQMWAARREAQRLAEANPASAGRLFN